MYPTPLAALEAATSQRSSRGELHEEVTAGGDVEVPRRRVGRSPAGFAVASRLD